MNEKKKRQYRVLALVLSFIMVATCMAIPAFAAEDQSAVDQSKSAITDDVDSLTDVVLEENQIDEDNTEAEPVKEEIIEKDGEEEPAEEPTEDLDAPVVTDPPAQVRGIELKWSGSTIILTWKKALGADGYEIWRSKEKRGSKYYSKIKTYMKGTSVKFYDKDMKKSRIYHYKVRAYALDSDGNKVYGSYSNMIKSGKTAARIPVATYHHFCKSSEFGRIGAYSSLYVTDKAFESQMYWLKKHGWRTITTDELADWHAGKIDLPYKSTLITFDDGCISVIKYALPILKKYNIKGTSFIQGNMTKSVTSTSPRSGYKDYYMGKDIITKVKKEYPNLEFQSHTWRMHDKISGKIPVSVMTYAQIKQDAMKMYNAFGTTAVAYPWGANNKKIRTALKATGVYKVAFTFRDDGYATRSQEAFKLKRFKVFGGKSLSSFTKWYQ